MWSDYYKMIEGIIQKVTRKYILRPSLQYESKNVAYQIEQEIIAEIKKLELFERDRLTLIGDTE
jgi:hypothetical protein